MSVIKPKRKLHGCNSQQEDTHNRLLKTCFYVRTADEFSFVLCVSCCRSRYQQLTMSICLYQGSRIKLVTCIQVKGNFPLPEDGRTACFRNVVLHWKLEVGKSLKKKRPLQYIQAVWNKILGQGCLFTIRPIYVFI